MASISNSRKVNNSTGKTVTTRMIEFAFPKGKRNRIKLGSMPLRDVETIRSRIQLIVIAKHSQRPVDSETALWIGSLVPSLADRLAEIGLIPARKKGNQTTLAAFLDEYFAKRADVKEATQTVYRRVRRHLVRHAREPRDARLGHA